MGYLRFFSALTETLTAVALSGGYASLFLMTFLEAIPLIGILIPGHVIIVAAGFLVAVGVLHLMPVLIIAMSAAVLGDFLSFFIGRRFGWPLVDRLRRFFFVKDAHIEKARRLLDSHTGKALIIGRFNPVTRGIIPFLVGANRVPAGPFWLYNTLGAIAWASSSVALGYAIGLGYHVAEGWMGRLVVAAVIFGLLIIWGYRFVNVRFHAFRRYELFALGLNLISLYVLARMVQDAVSAHSFMAGFDLYVNGAMNGLAKSLHGRQWVDAALAVSTICGTVATSSIGVVAGVYLAIKEKWRSAAIALMSLGGAAFLTGWMKDFFMRGRPADLLVPSLVFDPSFPSAHAAFAGAFFTVLVYLGAPRIHSWVARELLLVVSVLLTVAVGLSRLVLNAHWASDVIAGWALGIFCATGSILLVRYVGALIWARVDRESS